MGPVHTAGLWRAQRKGRKHWVCLISVLTWLSCTSCFGPPLRPAWRAQRQGVRRHGSTKDFVPHGAAMFTAGAVLGPALDGVSHGNFGVLAYHSPPPVPILIGSWKLFSTAIWVPPLFGFAGFLIGSLYWLIDDYLQIPSFERQPSLSQTLAAVAVFTANYVASGVMSSNQLDVGLIAAILAAWAFLTWRSFDGTKTGLIVGVMTAVGGTLIEIFLTNAPWWDLYAYTQADFFGVDSWTGTWLGSI